jgi:thiol-disulfide isomerase/thioredoxin
MDRLPAVRCALAAVAALAALAAACGGGGEKPALSRSESVAASGQAPDSRRWCDVFYAGADAPALALPRVEAARAGEALPVLPADRWVWVNVWATWCGPCRREMPVLLRWHDRLVKEGRPFDLWFLSVDERQQDLVQFLNDNPETAPGNSVRLAAPGGLERWLAGFKGAPTGAIPLQVIAAPGGKVRCIRAGALRDADYPVVKALLAP